MDEIRKRVERLQNRNFRREPLWRLVDDELEDIYTGDIPTNLSPRFLSACYTRIASDEDPYDRLEKYHDNYSEQWLEDTSEQAQLATALKLLLHERVGRSEGNVIGGVTIQLLSELIVAMRTSSEEYSDHWHTQKDRQTQLDSAPKRENQPEALFEDRLPFQDTLRPKLYDWLGAPPEEFANNHAVYVLDCTPATGEAEDSKIQSLRGRVARSDAPTRPIERGAQAANNDARVFYVGYASNLQERMHRHDSLPSGGGASFTATFRPKALVEVSWYETEAAALENERKRAEELTQPGVSFAYSEKKV